MQNSTTILDNEQIDAPIQIDIPSTILEQTGTQIWQDTQVKIVPPTRSILMAFKRMMQKMEVTIPKEARKSNYHGQALRTFQLPTIQMGEFMSNDMIRSAFGTGITACYLFKFRYPHKDLYTHGLYLRLNGFSPRRLLDTFAENIVELFSGGQQLTIRSATPHIHKNVAIFDYLQSLFVMNRNLIVNYASNIDALPQNATQLSKHYHQKLAKLTSNMKRTASVILDNMVQMPSMYTTSQLFFVLTLTPDDYKSYMRMTTINDFIFNLCQDAYNIALQDSQFKVVDVQQLMDPLTRRSIINTFANEKIFKSVQQLLHQTFSLSFVHPHPYINLGKGDLPLMRPFDAMIFDPKFLLPLLLCSRWFAKSCMRSEGHIQNNNAHLLLYGQTGSGKSLIMSILSSNIPTYRYVTNGRFQNPEILSSSFFFVDEFDTIQLASNQYKALLDIKASVKVDLKNMHPENVSEGVPCMISTNDEIFSVLRNAPTKRPQFSTQPPVNQSSVEAALRRLYIVPVKLGQYDKLHAKLPQTSKHWKDVGLFSNNFDEEPDKLSRFFNFLVTFALFQTDIEGLQFSNNLHYYFNKLIRDFQGTIFGMFYLTNKVKIDTITAGIEAMMVEPEINDTEYLCSVALGAGSLQGLMNQFLLEMASFNFNVNSAIIKEASIPWPIRMYYMKNDQVFVTKSMCQCTDFLPFLNREVLSFISDRTISAFTMEESKESMVCGDLGPEDSCMSAAEEDIEVLDPLLFEPTIFDHFSVNQRTPFGEIDGTLDQPRQYIQRKLIFETLDEE